MITSLIPVALLFGKFVLSSDVGVVSERPVPTLTIPTDFSSGSFEREINFIPAETTEFRPEVAKFSLPLGWCINTSRQCVYRSTHFYPYDCTDPPAEKIPFRFIL